jgi:hypothetical protein
MIFWKIVCLALYHLGDLACKFGDARCYQFLMLKSADISDKYNLDIWKEVKKPLDES